ncbi:hypothetical protein HI914_06616 [Erysiphe necator]|nr:hypothetical protein HI914_06616 [Erysiphe necator]
MASVAWKEGIETTLSSGFELLAIPYISSWLIWCDRNFDNLALDIEQELTKLITNLKYIDIQQHLLILEAPRVTIKNQKVKTGKVPADGVTECHRSSLHNLLARITANSSLLISELHSTAATAAAAAAAAESPLKKFTYGTQ